MGPFTLSLLCGDIFVVGFFNAVEIGSTVDEPEILITPEMLDDACSPDAVSDEEFPLLHILQLTAKARFLMTAIG